eukprot:1816330-Rhodomonas_salina.1
MAAQFALRCRVLRWHIVVPGAHLRPLHPPQQRQGVQSSAYDEGVPGRVPPGVTCTDTVHEKPASLWSCLPARARTLAGSEIVPKLEVAADHHHRSDKSHHSGRQR